MPAPDDDAIRRALEDAGAVQFLVDLRADVDCLREALVTERRDGTPVARAARFDWRGLATAFGIAVTPIVVAWVTTH